MGCEDGPMAKSERDKFTSFRDLQRARGGGGQGEEAAPDSARAGRGYTLEGASSPEELEGGADPADGARERIDARPDASGVMQTGPPCYRDPDSDELELLHSFRARLCFPDDVEGEVARLPDDPSDSDFQGRLDLREDLALMGGGVRSAIP